jgi:hypothetical protein
MVRIGGRSLEGTPSLLGATSRIHSSTSRQGMGARTT